MNSDSYQTEGTSKLCVNDEENHGHVASPVSSNDQETTPLLSEPATRTRRDSMGDAIKHPYEIEGEEFLVEHSSGVFGVMHGYSAQEQIKSWWFVLTTLLSIIMMLRLNYFMATIGTQYQYIFGSFELADQINKFFDVALPLGGLISVPFIGLFLDNCSTVDGFGYNDVTFINYWVVGFGI